MAGAQKRQYNLLLRKDDVLGMAAVFSHGRLEPLQKIFDKEP